MSWAPVTLLDLPGGGTMVWSPVASNTYYNKVGTLVVEMADTKSKQLVWRGSVSDTISSKANRNISTLDKAVTKLFKEYPPKQKK